MEVGKQRDSFVFYRSFAKSIDFLPDELKLPLYEAISSYALDLIEPSFSEYPNGFVLEAVWQTIKPQIDANYKRYLVGCKGAEYGKLGGAPKRNQNARKKQPQNNPKTTPNENENEDVNYNENENGNVNVSFPTLEEISSYASSIGSRVVPERFHDFYSTTGWVDKNGNPIKDWKSLFRYWSAKESSSEKPKEKKVISGADIFKVYG